MRPPPEKPGFWENLAMITARTALVKGGAMAGTALTGGNPLGGIAGSAVGSAGSAALMNEYEKKRYPAQPQASFQPMGGNNEELQRILQEIMAT